MLVIDHRLIFVFLCALSKWQMHAEGLLGRFVLGYLTTLQYLCDSHSKLVALIFFCF